MDGDRFDHLTRGLARGTSRRAVLKTLAGGVFGGASLLGASLDRSAAAKGSCPSGVICHRVCCPNAADVCLDRQCSAPCASGLICGGQCCPDASDICLDGQCVSCSSGVICQGQCCPAGQTCCGGACTDFSTNVNNCGRCGNACTTSVANATPTCKGGTCGYACTAGFQPCGDGTCVPNSGCCTDSQCANLTDPCHTGVCQSHACVAQVTAGAACDDGNACTTGTICRSDGSCGGGTPVSCDDGLACTTDRCDPATGCGHTVNAGACLIAGTCYASGDPNPVNACQRCDPSSTSTAWTNLAQGTSCGAGASCAAGTGGGAATATSATVCDGAGTCQSGTQTSCGLSTICNAAGTACASSCTSDTDCVGTAYCDPTTSTCQDDKTNGASCTEDAECKSGHCANGVCCDTACTGNPCMTCSGTNLAGANRGTCSSYLNGVGCITAQGDVDGKCCGGTCVDENIDPNNCGACGNVCPAGETCFGLFINGNGGGFCGCYISNGTPQHCPSGQACCNGACADLQTDNNHCGACGTICPTGLGSTCQNGQCVGGSLCGPGQAECNGQCVDTLTDINNCGGCGTVCAAPPAHGVADCELGKCTVTCDAGYTNCNGVCVNTQSDNNNCGACAHACPCQIDGGQCSNGSCCLASGALCASCNGTLPCCTPAIECGPFNLLGTC